MPRVIIRHQTGSKAHQNDYLDFVDAREVLIGRDQQVCALAYDENRDETVSRKHAKIVQNSGDPTLFTIENFSGNGTFVDGRRINAPTPLHHGCEVRFGASGPSFIFEIDPPPASAAPKLTVMDFGDEAPAVKPVPVQVFITHVTGSKAPVTQFLDFSRAHDVLIGREASCAVAYDDAREQTVSREHARIIKNSGDQFTIENLSRSNGTFVDGQKISATTRLRHGSEVRLGQAGPSFKFNLDPPPSSRDTRLEFSDGTGAQDGKDDPWYLKRRTISEADYEKEPDSTGRQWDFHKIALPASILVLIAVIAIGSLLYLKRPMDTAAILQVNGPAVVSIDVTWRLFDPESGRQAYHWYVLNPYGGASERIPVFVRTADGSIQPVLILDDEKDTNRAIGGRVSGSGCVVQENGFVLTSSPIAAPFNSPYSWPANISQGLLIDAGDHTTSELKDFPAGWIPSGSHFIITRRTSLEDVRMGRVESAERRLEGRLDAIIIGFSGSQTRINAKLVGVAASGRIALFKADSLHALNFAAVTKNKNPLAAADRVYLIGYGAGAPKKAMARLASVVKVIDGAGQTSGVCSGCYLVSESGADAGFNGAPAFDDHGRLVGVFLMQIGEKEKSFAVVRVEQAADLLGLSQK